MQIVSPYQRRSRVAGMLFWLMLMLLVNGWVDGANASLRDSRFVDKAQNQLLEDDFDTFYEWIAESYFDIEDAVPEQNGDSDDTGKMNALKIVLDFERQLIHDFSIPDLNTEYIAVYKLNLPPHINLSIWHPPPNA
jgi:hypothetical protein